MELFVALSFVIREAFEIKFIIYETNMLLRLPLLFRFLGFHLMMFLLLGKNFEILLQLVKLQMNRRMTLKNIFQADKGDP